MKLNKQYIVFIIIFILLIVSIIYRVKNPFVQKEVDTLTYTGKGKSDISLKQNRKKTRQRQSGILVSSFLNRSESSGEIIKDLFSIYNSPGDMEEKITTDGPIDENIDDDPISKIIKDLLFYRFYGSYKSEGKRAVFLGRDKLVLVARVGDRIDGKYLIEELQDNHIRIKALDLNETVHIDMRKFNNE